MSMRRFLLHVLFLVVALGCLATYAHFKAAGRSDLSIASLVAAAIIGFAPVRDLLRIAFKVACTTWSGLALVALTLTGVVSGAPLLTHAAMAPFAIMGAAQAVMHQGHPRNAQQAAAMQRFAASLPEVAQFAGGSLASPANAARAVVVLSDILSKAQALGQTELEADPGFQSALRHVSTRFGANLGLDAVDLVLAKLTANPATAGAVPGLRAQLATARRTLSGVAPEHRAAAAAPR